MTAATHSEDQNKVDFITALKTVQTDRPAAIQAKKDYEQFLKDGTIPKWCRFKDPARLHKFPYLFDRPAHDIAVACLAGSWKTAPSIMYTPEMLEMANNIKGDMENAPTLGIEVGPAEGLDEGRIGMAVTIPNERHPVTGQRLYTVEYNTVVEASPYLHGVKQPSGDFRFGVTLVDKTTGISPERFKKGIPLRINTQTNEAFLGGQNLTEKSTLGSWKIQQVNQVTGAPVTDEDGNPVYEFISTGNDKNFLAVDETNIKGQVPLMEYVLRSEGYISNRVPRAQQALQGIQPMGSIVDPTINLGDELDPFDADLK